MKCYFSFKAKCDEINGIKPVKSNTFSSNDSKPDQVEEKETTVHELHQDDVIKSRFFFCKILIDIFLTICFKKNQLGKQID